MPSGRTDMVLTRFGSSPTGDIGVAEGATVATIGVSDEGATGEASACADALGAGEGVAAAGEADGEAVGRAERSTGASFVLTSLGAVGVGCALSRVNNEPLSLAVRMVVSLGGGALVGAVEARISGGAPERE